MLLRLKQYTAFMFERFHNTLQLVKPPETRTTNDKLIITSFATTGQSVLYFNQSEVDRTFEDWSTDPENPVAYQLKLNHCLSLLITSAFWAMGASALDVEIFPEKVLFGLQLNDFKIEEKPDEEDGLTTQFYHTCGLLHRKCPHNTRLRESLIMLIWSYITAKDLTAQARNMSHFDRIEYLRHLSKYTL